MVSLAVLALLRVLTVRARNTDAGLGSDVDRSTNFGYACSTLPGCEQRFTSVIVPLVVPFPSDVVIEHVGNVAGYFDRVLTIEFVLEASPLVCPVFEVEVGAVSRVILIWLPSVIAKI
ncbi:hypothetical protein ACFQH8_13595 [Halomicroarcula sp. GCM10025710]